VNGVKLLLVLSPSPFLEPLPILPLPLSGIGGSFGQGLADFGVAFELGDLGWRERSES
jgi:hypothetical protein